jgi:anti-sigma regulatory factor (Ser/Thr protein kinase)
VSFSATLTIPSRVAAIDDARRWVSGHLAGRDEEDVWKVELALTEALSNVIRHAYGGDETREVELALRLDGDRLELEIAHEGEPFDRAGYSPPDLDAVGTGGYGLFLIEELVDEVDFEGTRLRMVKCRWKEQG